MANDHRFRHGNPERERNDVGRGDLKLARTAAHGAVGG